MTPREQQLTAQLEQCQQALAVAQRENLLLRQKIDALARRIFGVSSEALDPAQLQLLLQMPELKPAENPLAPVVVEKRKPIVTVPKHRKAPRLPENLPVVEEVIDPEPVKEQPENWRLIGQEVNEQLDYEPGRFLRRRTIRRKYVHRTQADAVPIIAPLPECLQERGLAAPGLLAHVLVSKYCDHLPLYRQEQIFAQRHKINLSRQTLGRWVELAADWLKPIYEHIRTGVMAGGYVQVDETPINYLEPGNGKTKQGYLWTGSRPGGDVFFRWETSRAAACLDNIIPVDFAGTIQCDGYSAYRAFAADRKGAVALAGCWAHVRRKFFEALESSPRTAAWIMRQLQHLYLIESRLREVKAGPQLRQAVRAHQSRPIVQRLERALLRFKAGRRHLPQSPMGSAIDYALGQWTSLQGYLDDGRIEIDNNLVENAIRPTAIGKKNWLFIGEANAGERGAVVYTVIESCRRRGIDPYAYLRDVLTRLPHMTNRQISEVIPSAWRKAHLQLQRQAAS
ncbi:MAG TPA: IS66 family transposase [Candidatus Angelobacter sp.]|jgi:transposase|nr:IS66 family transposase [Candidatus Angelobacter sp.]